MSAKETPKKCAEIKSLPRMGAWQTVPHQNKNAARPANALCAATDISKSARAEADSGLTSLWELNLQSTGVPVSRGSYLSPLGQELAPWQLHQVAVASAGLSPQPLLISAAGYSSNESIAKPRPQSRAELCDRTRTLARTVALARNTVARGLTLWTGGNSLAA
jgi:hypothetical protein